MISKRCISLIITLMTAVCLWGQNSIDRLVEDYSTSGNSTFTSVVQRDPKTKRVIKMVKNLKTGMPNAGKLIHVFQQEIKTRSYLSERKQGWRSYTFDEENERSTRLYTIRYDDGRVPQWAEISIIIAIKEGKKK